MEFYLFLLLIFLAGAMIDVLITEYTRAVANKKVWTATISAMLITLVNFLFIVLILKDSQTNSILNVLVFAFGNGVGTYFIMRKNSKKN